MLPLAGYTDRLSARPGQILSVHLSSTGTEPVEVRLVRLLCADPNPDGPGRVEEDLGHLLCESVPSRVQRHHLGSYAHAPLPPMPGGAVTIAATVWPTTPGGRRQGVVSAADGAGGLALAIGADGAAEAVLSLGHAEHRASTGRPLAPRAWARIWASHDPETGRLAVGQIALAPQFGPEPPAIAVAEAPPGAPPWPERLAIAALAADPPEGLYNGKIEAPALLRGFAEAPPEAAEPLAAWAFERDISGVAITDTGPHGCHGRLVNLPARAMTGSGWTGREMCWRHAPAEYGAIHFHDTDLADCGWEADLEIAVPEGLQSGAYALRLSCEGETDTLPVFVPPPKGRRGADLCVLIPTFTYVVYGNFARPDFSERFRERAAALGMSPHFPGDHPDYGRSTYNLHSDGSGVCHATPLRPMLTLRPGHLAYLDGRGSGVRHFPADTHLLHWLEEAGHRYDIVTDHELDEEGPELIAGYRCLLTATHPEYHTPATLDALTAYRDGGGRFCYLGGNGFYWRVARHPERPEAIEIRRAEGGIRAWAAEPGEYWHAFDGGYGGLWRRSGRPPQALAGVGFSAQGPLEGAPYRLTAATRDPRAAWIFEGVEGPLIGASALCGGGAAGFELDRADHRLGTPAHALILARSEGHSDAFMLVHEEQLTHLTTLPGEPARDLIRAEIVFFETPAGGAVFSTGSITFCSALPERGGDPGVRRMMDNVIRRFLDPAPFAMPEPRRAPLRP